MVATTSAQKEFGDLTGDFQLTLPLHEGDIVATVMKMKSRGRTMYGP